jgi:hypothetical protein
MKQILFNLAMLDTLNFCKEQNIDCSGSHLVKAQRGFTYSLINSATGRILVSVNFTNDSVPRHFINPMN